MRRVHSCREDLSPPPSHNKQESGDDKDEARMKGLAFSKMRKKAKAKTKDLKGRVDDEYVQTSKAHRQQLAHLQH